MKIALVCSHGGHLTEMFYLMEAFEGHDVFFVTYDSLRTRALTFKKILLKNIGMNPIRMLLTFFQIFWIFHTEKPKVVLSTGAEIAIPAFYCAKLLRIKTIFVESWCRVKNPSGTGRMVYRVSTLFLVQWPQLLNQYGNKAKFVGAVM